MARSNESQAQSELFKTFVTSFSQARDITYLERAIYDQVHNLASEASGVSYEDISITKDIPCKWIRPEKASKEHCMLFMHGGGYSSGSPNGHRKMAAHLAKACNVQALSVDYRLTPETTYPASLEDCVTAYEWLLHQGFKPEHIITCGDSCGGGLSTAVSLITTQRGLPKPAAAVSLSPWYDLTMSGESMRTNDQNDVLNSWSLLMKLALKYAVGALDPKNPLVSPLFASEQQLKALPPHWISACGYDQLLDDAIRFAERAKKAGVDVVLEVHEGQQHVMEFMAGKAPEADESIRKIGEWVKAKIGS